MPPLPSQVQKVGDSTADVVNLVTNTPGAIRYVALSAASSNDAITVLDIDSQAPGAASVESGQYKFWAIEHMYTNANPDQLTTSFITFVTQNMKTGSTFIRVNDIPHTVLETR
jgi:phosphate transport system substrate-binding protein